MDNIDQHSATFSNALIIIREIRQKLIELSNTDLSSVHVHHEWSWIPYLKDHLEFLVEQTTGIENALRDAPPPVAEKDIECVMQKNQNQSEQIF